MLVGQIIIQLGSGEISDTDPNDWQVLQMTYGKNMSYGWAEQHSREKIKAISRKQNMSQGRLLLILTIWNNKAIQVFILPQYWILWKSQY
jgi:hypothetical protein